MASLIDGLRKTRYVVRSGVTRALNKLSDLMQQPSPDAATLSSHVDFIVQQDAELTALNGKIAEATDDDALEQELEGAAEYNRKVSYAVSRARFLLRNAQPNAPVASEGGTTAASAHDPKARRSVQNADLNPAGQSETPVPSALALTAETESPATPACPLCDSRGHKVADCRVSQSVAEKTVRLRNARCCFRCGRRNHVALQCRASCNLTCCTGNGRHLTVVCDMLRPYKLDKVHHQLWGRLRAGTPEIRQYYCRRPEPVQRDLSKALKFTVLDTEELALVTFGRTKAHKILRCRRVEVTLRGQARGDPITLEALEVPKICSVTRSGPNRSSRLPRAAFPSARSAGPPPTPSALRKWKLSTEILILIFYPMTPLVLMIGRHHHSRTDKRLPHQPRLPPLPLEDYKVVNRPRTGLILAQWLIQCVTNAISAAAQISDATQDRITFRIRRDQNLVVLSTPDLDIAKKIQQITTLNMESKQYEVTAYIAVPDNSSKGIITGIAANTTTDELVEHLRSPNAESIHARMMGKSTTALLTIAGLRVPHYVNYYGGGYRCRVFQPRHQVCRICLKLGQGADVCPSLDTHRCSACGKENPVPDHVPRGHGYPLPGPPTTPIQQDACSSIFGIDKPLATIFPSRHYPSVNTTDCTSETGAHQTQGSLQSCATTKRPLADSELPSTESGSCGRSNSHDRRRGDRGRSASHGQSRVPGCSREASDSRGNQAPPNLRLQSTNLQVSWTEQFPPLPSNNTFSSHPITTPYPTPTHAPPIPDALQAMRTDLQAQFTATIQKLQADVDELRQQHTRALQHYTATIDEIRSQLRTHHESLRTNSEPS
ncbi:hypothetical protein HPB48_013949 [Haemaphysalis longicornis]|uniref:CCHC-type domain-containing protein n=1 Tax=Haemaphysalis longicornis TaxID=44386 RepID=A0A9J6H1A6_HAELO|nr:hypothetical protein HPB48_013949 [Haemaphysalis longicornis]